MTNEKELSVKSKAILAFLSHTFQINVQFHMFLSIEKGIRRNIGFGIIKRAYDYQSGVIRR